MIDHDDVRFSSFTRDLARRHRRPRSYPPGPSVSARGDALEQLCGGGSVARRLDLEAWEEAPPSSDVPESEREGDQIAS